MNIQEIQERFSRKLTYRKCGCVQTFSSKVSSE